MITYLVDDGDYNVPNQYATGLNKNCYRIQIDD